MENEEISELEKLKKKVEVRWDKLKEETKMTLQNKLMSYYRQKRFPFTGENLDHVTYFEEHLLQKALEGKETLKKAESVFISPLLRWKKLSKKERKHLKEKYDGYDGTQKMSKYDYIIGTRSEIHLLKQHLCRKLARGKTITPGQLTFLAYFKEGIIEEAIISTNEELDGNEIKKEWNNFESILKEKRSNLEMLIKEETNRGGGNSDEFKKLERNIKKITLLIDELEKESHLYLDRFIHRMRRRYYPETNDYTIFGNPDIGERDYTKESSLQGRDTRVGISDWWEKGLMIIPNIFYENEIKFYNSELERMNSFYADYNLNEFPELEYRPSFPIEILLKNIYKRSIYQPLREASQVTRDLDPIIPSLALFDDVVVKIVPRIINQQRDNEGKLILTESEENRFSLASLINISKNLKSFLILCNNPSGNKFDGKYKSRAKLTFLEQNSRTDEWEEKTREIKLELGSIFIINPAAPTLRLFELLDAEDGMDALFVKPQKPTGKNEIDSSETMQPAKENQETIKKHLPVNRSILTTRQLTRLLNRDKKLTQKEKRNDRIEYQNELQDEKNLKIEKEKEKLGQKKAAYKQRMSELKKMSDDQILDELYDMSDDLRMQIMKMRGRFRGMKEGEIEREMNRVHDEIERRREYVEGKGNSKKMKFSKAKTSYKRDSSTQQHEENSDISDLIEELEKKTKLVKLILHNHKHKLSLLSINELEEIVLHLSKK